VVTLNDAAKDALRFYVERKSGAVEYLEAMRDEDAERSPFWLFPSERGGKPLGRGRAWTLVKGWCNAVGADGNFGTHTLRKTWGHWALKAGTPLEVIQAALGHHSPETTRAYLGISRQDVADVYRKVQL